MPRGRPKKNDIQLTKDDILALKSLVGLAKQLQEQNNSSVVEESKPVSNKKKIKSKEEVTGSRAGKSKKLDRGNNKNYTRRLPLDTSKGRVNLFEKMDIFKKKNVEKDDEKWDKKWKKDFEMSPRSRETLVTINCNVCNNQFEVSPNELTRDFDNKIKYTCNECIGQNTGSDEDYEEDDN